MQLRFGFSRCWNDHHCYPRGVVRAPPAGFSYREVDVEFEPGLGRPWCRFDVEPGEFIHASSLISCGQTPWVFDTDHPQYLVQQMSGPGGDAGIAAAPRDALKAIARSLLSPYRIGLIAISEACAASLTDMFADADQVAPEVCVAYPSVVPPDDPIDDYEAMLLRQFVAQADPEAVRLLTIDSLPGVCDIPGRKNLVGAKDCFNALRQAGLRVELVSISPQNLGYGFADGVHSLPRLSRSALWRTYQASDILLFLTHADSFGFALLEAMSMGLACIATDAPSAPAIREMITEGETGFLIGVSSPRPYPEFSIGHDKAALMTTARRLVEDAALRIRIGSAACALFEPGARHSIDVRNHAIRRHVERGVEAMLRSTGRPIQEFLGAESLY